MDHPGDLKERTIGSADMHGNDTRAGDPNQPGDIFIPGWVTNLSGNPIHPGDFPGGKDEEHSPGSKPPVSGFQASAVESGCRGSSEGIDEDREIMAFGNPVEE
jgi:hypothetical protein